MTSIDLKRLSAGAVAGLAIAAFAPPPDAAAQEWGGSLTFYGWVPAIDMDVDADTDASTSLSVSGIDVIDALKFPFMASGELHYGKFSLLNDTIYSTWATAARSLARSPPASTSTSRC